MDEAWFLVSFEFFYHNFLDDEGQCAELHASAHVILSHDIYRIQCIFFNFRMLQLRILLGSCCRTLNARRASWHFSLALSPGLQGQIYKHYLVYCFNKITLKISYSVICDLVLVFSVLSCNCEITSRETFQRNSILNAKLIRLSMSYVDCPSSS